jgi:outer membrane protein assembly factor BamE (lipoprotein component of BamABCDE complex)
MAPIAMELHSLGGNRHVFFQQQEVTMNIKTLGLPLAVAAFFALAGCSTPTVVTLQNGTQYLTKDMPKTKTKDGFFEFEDISGAKVKVKADDVATIRQED